MLNTSEKAEKQSKSDKKPLWFSFAWASRGVAVAVSVILMMQVTYYATEFLGLGAGIVGTVLLVSKLFDGVTDLVIGFIIDRTDTKWGKGRPFELFVIPLWIAIILLFSTPDIGQTGQLVYLFILYTIIFSLFSTFLVAAETVYLGRAVEDDAERGKVLAISGVVIMFAGAIGNMILPTLMDTVGREPGGWTRIGLMFGIPMIIIGLIRFALIRERKTSEFEVKQGKLTFKEGISAVKQNKYIFILGIIILGANLIQHIVTIAGPFYFTYIMENLSLLGLVGLVGLVAPFLLLLFPVAVKTIGAVGFVKIGLLLALVSNIVRFLIPTNLPVVLITVMISGIGASTITMMNHFFILQCIDYGEQKTGVRVEGIPTSITNFAAKIGQGVASVSVGLILSIGGYVGAQTVQSSSALFAIRSVYSLVPAVLCLVMLIALHFYDVEKKMKPAKNVIEEDDQLLS